MHMKMLLHLLWGKKLKVAVLDKEKWNAVI